MTAPRAALPDRLVIATGNDGKLTQLASVTACENGFQGVPASACA